MNKETTYGVATSYDTDHLSSQVSAYMALGFECCGPVVITISSPPELGISATFYYAQAMIKPEGR